MEHSSWVQCLRWYSSKVELHLRDKLAVEDELVVAGRSNLDRFLRWCSSTVELHLLDNSAVVV